MPLKPLLALFALLTLAACADRNAELALAAQPALTGLPKTTLLSCAGVPTRSQSSGPLEYMTYDAQTTTGYISGVTAVRTCRTTLALRNGVVEHVTYSGDDAPGTCYVTVRPCVPPGGPAR